jgi:hypothetical protein
LLITAVLIILILTSCGGGSGSKIPPPVGYSIGGTVSNLAVGDSVQLQDNGGDTLNVNTNGSFTFATYLASGNSYKVTISTQPASPPQTCAVTNGSGTVTANVTNVLVDCGHNEWTWTSGSNLVGQGGTYGTKGTPASDNVPGARWYTVSWIDKAGNSWLFGGMGDASVGNIYEDLNDLWEYSNGEWTWMSGSNVLNQTGTYGAEGTPAPGNVPGARDSAVSWIDASGNLWLFGGYGYDSTGAQGYLNDLWEYSNGEWTWMSGANVANQAGTYGNKGTPSSGNVPGARDSAVSWIDASGNFWLFGGGGYDSTGTLGSLNDLWEYSNGEWTWMSGSNVANQAGTYGIKGTPASSNVPGGRWNAASSTDMSGNFWLFGGTGYDSTGTGGALNDLWEYNNGEWTWISGSNVNGQAGTYGTKGTPASANVPGARDSAVSWIDASGNFWLFGGHWNLNDLWKYGAGEWTWVSGSNSINQIGTYGTEGMPAPGNVPGERYGSVAWTDASGNLWLFGGYYDIASDNRGAFNDLWKYEP